MGRAGQLAIAILFVRNWFQQLVEGYDALGIIHDDSTCEAITTSSDAYWDAVTACEPCVKKGCGYCKSGYCSFFPSSVYYFFGSPFAFELLGLSTLSCMGGDANGPHSDVPCPSWVWEESGGCPVVPACGDLMKAL